MNLDSVVRSLIPPELAARSPEEARQARFIVILSAASVVGCFLYAIRHHVTHHVMGAAVCLYGSSVASLGVPIVLRSTRSSLVAANVLGAILYLGIGGTSYFRGGFIPSVLMWVTLVPMVTILLHERRSMYAWSAACAALCISLFALERFGLAPEEKLHTTGIVGLIGFMGILLLLAVLYDSGRERLEQQKAELERQVVLQQRLEALGRLAGGIAHDFNNLLTVTRTHASLAAEDLGRAHPQFDDLKTIREAAERGATLTRQLLALGRQDVVTPETFDPNQRIRAVERLLRRAIPASIDLRVDLDPEIWFVHADATQLEQVVMNLAMNARDALGNDGVLEMRTKMIELNERDSASHEIPAGRYVEITVEDDGAGIDEATVPHIFEPFFTTKERDRGTGLGLATAYAIVRRAGGAITVESEPGRGATFRIFLPASRPSIRPSAERVSTSGRRRTGRATVLVAEDEPSVRHAVTRILTRHGYRVVSAEDGARALELATEHAGSVELLLTDVVMPGMSGYELAEQVAKLHPNVRVLYMSGYADDEAVAEQVASGAAAFIPKPYDNAELLEKVERTLDEEPG